MKEINLVRPSKWTSVKYNAIKKLLKDADTITDGIHDYGMELAYGKEIYRDLELELFNVYIDCCEILDCVPFSMSWKTVGEG